MLGRNNKHSFGIFLLQWGVSSVLKLYWRMYFLACCEKVGEDLVLRSSESFHDVVEVFMSEVNM
jgi:hypothetical protein